MLKVDDHPDLLETIKQSNPKLKNIAMSVAERLRQEGRKQGKKEGEKLKAHSIAKSMLLKGYSVALISEVTKLSIQKIENIDISTPNIEL